MTKARRWALSVVVLGYPHVIEAQPNPDGDFAARCSDANVVRCYAFDDSADLAPRMYDPSGGPGPCTNNRCWQVDTVNKASGAGSLRFEIPSHSPADTSGSFWINFRDDSSVQFGGNESFFIQWRQRFSPEFITTHYAGGGGWKQTIIGTGDQPGQPYYSCTALEVVTVNGYHRGFPQMYNSCTGSTSHGPFDGFEEPFGTYDFKMQNARPTPFCLYSQGQSNPPSYFPPAGNCFGYFPNEWITFQINIQTGPRVGDEFVGSRVKMWMARPGQPSELVFDWGPYNLTAGGPGQNQRFGKLWFLPYNTGKDPAQSHPVAYTWHDELIISRARIADPGAAPQSALTVDDVTVTEGDAGPTPAVFTVRLSGSSAQNVTVGFATVDGTAGAPGDYTAASGTLTIAAGVTTGTIPVSVIGDTGVETDETFMVSLANASGATIADAQGLGTISDDDAPPLSGLELSHGASIVRALAGGAIAGQDSFGLGQAPRASYEVVVDAASGDVSPAVVERLAADQSTVLQIATSVGTGTSRSLRWQNTSAAAVLNQPIRVRSGGCTSDCGADDTYRIRAWETTYTVPRFNNSGTQVTVLLVQNTTNRPVAGRAYFWNSGGALLGSHAFQLDPRAELVLNAASVAGTAGQVGSITVAHDGGYGALAGKAVALEPASGFSFDSPLSGRAR